MNVAEMVDLVKKIYSENEDEYYYIGLRFEDKERELGEECEWNRHNPDREDEREFPEFGSDEYDELEELDGTSAWYIDDTQIFGLPSRFDGAKECQIPQTLSGTVTSVGIMPADFFCIFF